MMPHTKLKVDFSRKGLAAPVGTGVAGDEEPVEDEGEGGEEDKLREADGGGAGDDAGEDAGEDAGLSSSEEETTVASVAALPPFRRSDVVVVGVVSVGPGVVVTGRPFPSEPACCEGEGEEVDLTGGDVF